MNLQPYTEYYSNLWLKGQKRLPSFSIQYSKEEKYIREGVLDDFLTTLRVLGKEKLKGNKLRTFKDRFLLDTQTLLHDGMDFSESQLSVMFSSELIDITKEFVRKARSFDRELPLNDIFQACRNVWIMLGIQMIMGIKPQLTSAVFAYSMLYPYSDNLIDEPSLSEIEKKDFSNRFYNRLMGEKLEAMNKTENAVFTLVSMIEEQFPRSKYPDVFGSLLNIHRAQTLSMKLIHAGDILSDKEILEIAIEKGGASVMADGYLVAGDLNESQKHFLFGYGAYLQLLDDIQDVAEDGKGGLMTVFSKGLLHSKLDEFVNQTYWFGKEIMQSLDFFDGHQLDVFKSLMKKSIDLFIIEAIAQSPDHFSEAYIQSLEQFSPFRFSFIRKRNNSFNNYHGFIMSMVEEYVVKKESLNQENARIPV